VQLKLREHLTTNITQVSRTGIE